MPFSSFGASNRFLTRGRTVRYNVPSHNSNDNSKPICSVKPGRWQPFVLCFLCWRVKYQTLLGDNIKKKKKKGRSSTPNCKDSIPKWCCSRPGSWDKLQLYLPYLYRCELTILTGARYKGRGGWPREPVEVRIVADGLDPRVPPSQDIKPPGANHWLRPNNQAPYYQARRRLSFVRGMVFSKRTILIKQSAPPCRVAMESPPAGSNLLWIKFLGRWALISSTKACLVDFRPREGKGLAASRMTCLPAT
ncbi:hypothetical protein LX32DRAFT_157819 [Colletotrichum zoysiae]|uniref:Uncharacterized protein n=1 Tax=Colletotrichum zoysiae TaxID=1216348 RepID=A0AAD9M3E8_9PEZI|nr:hypothetical protein LX32DRAFT_157819 [Colletotrichum zoysiae]